MWQVMLLSRDAQESPLTREQQVGKGGARSGLIVLRRQGPAPRIPHPALAPTGNQDGAKE